tara:strand:- start:469 stop:1782 length:1314 start_codon:yes stop_codon:yes gene_type:complete
MSEENLTQHGEKLIRCLHALSSALKLYEMNNSAVVRQVDEIDKALQSYFASTTEELRLTLREDEFFVNSKLLKVDLAFYNKARDVAIILEPLHCNDIRFTNEYAKPQLEKWLGDVSQSLRKNQNILDPNGYGCIFGKKAKGSSAAAFRFEPDRLAIWLYSGLLDVVDQIFALYDELQREDDDENDMNSKKEISLLPIRRSLQLIIDNMRQHNGIYQMLSAIREPNQSRSKAQTKVAVAIDSIGFGIFIGLKSTDIMNLALAAILSGLQPSEDPLTNVDPLFSFSGLGMSAPHVILTLFESRGSRLGMGGNPISKVLMVIEMYHKLLNKNLKTPLPELIYHLAQGKEEGIDPSIVKFFARYKGPFPIGSLLELDGDGQKKKAIVVAHSDNELGKQRPTVMLLKKGNRPGKNIHLASDSTYQISSSLSVSTENIRLSDL